MNSKTDPNQPQRPSHAVHYTQPRKRECHGMLKYKHVDNYRSEECSSEERDDSAPNANGQDGSCGQNRRLMSVS